MEYEIIGEKRVINGETYYKPGYLDMGCNYGHVYKNEQAFKENPDEVCYIAEGAFKDAEPTIIDGEKFYHEDEVGGDTRKTLEELCEPNDPWDVEELFQELVWTFPSTLILEWCDAEQLGEF